MKQRRRLLLAGACVIGLVLAVLLGSLALIESEEVITLRTRDASGGRHSTRVWIIDYDGFQWVAPGNRANGWFQRLLLDPRVEIVRGGERSCYTAAIVESPESIPVLEAILEKYAAVLRATTLLNLVLEPAGDPTPPVAARLEPIEGGCNST